MQNSKVSAADGIIGRDSLEYQGFCAGWNKWKGQVAHSWFHALRRAAPKRAERAARLGRLGSEIREIFEQSKRCYGAPRIHAELKVRGFRISKRTVAKLMRENGIRPPRGRRRAPVTTDSRHSHASAPNLLDRNFEATAPDAVWLADISYITTDEGWLYLAAVKDLATMESVGWSMAERLKSVLCEDALKMATRASVTTLPFSPRTQIAVLASDTSSPI